MRERCRWLGGRRKTPSQVVWKPLFEVVLTVWKRGERENKLTKWEMFTSKYFRQVFLGKYPLSGKTSSLLRFKGNTTAWIEWRAGSLAFGPAIAWESARGQSMVTLLQSASGLVAQIYDTDTHWLEETVKYGGIREVERRGGGGPAGYVCLDWRPQVIEDYLLARVRQKDDGHHITSANRGPERPQEDLTGD